LQSQANRLVKSFDMDGNGTIDFDEFLQVTFVPLLSCIIYSTCASGAMLCSIVRKHTLTHLHVCCVQCNVKQGFQRMVGMELPHGLGVERYDTHFVEEPEANPAARHTPHTRTHCGPPRPHGSV
jgi:hypothetical protein